jgi:hypothetical protein
MESSPNPESNLIICHFSPVLKSSGNALEEEVEMSLLRAVSAAVIPSQSPIIPNVTYVQAFDTSTS